MVISFDRSARREYGIFRNPRVDCSLESVSLGIWETEMDRLGAMRVFAAVADAGSLSAAGRKLKMPLATVSRQLAALEAQIGVRLVTRTTRHLALTGPGRG